MHVQHAASAELPEIHEGPEIVCGIKLTCRLINTYCMERFNAWEIFRLVTISTDNATTITENTYDTAVLPMGDSIFERQLKDTKNIPTLGLCLGLALDVGNEAWPRARLQLIQQ